MKINSQKNFNSNISYAGGLTKSMITDIRNTDVPQIQNYLAKNNINSDFQNNKFIAWSVIKVFEFIKELQNTFKLKLGYPNNIMVKGTKTLSIPDLEFAYGFCNLVPCRIHKTSDEITPAKSIIFNKDFPWDKINEISDFDFYVAKNTTTDFFLEFVFHEFSHIFHENHLLNTSSVNNVLKKLLSMTDPKIIQNYQQEYGQLVETQICKYARKEPMDLIACDMSGRLINHLDRDSIKPISNPIKNSPYEKFFFLKNFFNKKPQIDRLIKHIFDGETKMLNNID